MMLAATENFVTTSPQSFEEFLRACEKLGITPTQLILIINIAEQTASLFEQNKFVKKFPCSTSRFGIGH